MRLISQPRGGQWSAAGRRTPEALKRWLDGPRTDRRISSPPPLHRGKLTVRHVLGIEDPDEYSARSYKWARSAWEAWGEHHDRARAWVEEALAEQRRAG